MGHSGLAERVGLLQLVDALRWQRLQDHFASVLGIPIRTVSASRQLLVPPSWPATLQRDRTIELLRIGDELDPLIPAQQPPTECTSLTTPLGVTYAVVPIRATAELLVAYVVIGPFVVGLREEELQFRQRVGATGVDAVALWSLILSLKLYTFAGIRSVLTLMEEVGTSLVQFAYQARQLSAILPSSAPMDQAVMAYQTDRVLHSLLDAAMFATRADGGSVMICDARGALQIRAAQGLADEIIARTRLAPGEGIAGLALAEDRMLLLDGAMQDARLKQRMRRPDVVSAIVAPFGRSAAPQEPVGVLNLRSHSAGKRFTHEHVELLRRLLDLAGIALTSLRGAFSSERPSVSRP